MGPAFPVILFYKYVPIEDPAGLVESQRALCTSLGLKGRILIATEGINATLAGPREGIEQYIAALRSDARFADIQFKTSAGDENTFPKLMVKVRPEIVTLNAGVPLVPEIENQLPPAEWKRLLEEDPNAVILDTRNRYEWQLGRFENAITCDIENFKDLPAYVDGLKEELKDRKVLIYCTGGIRCEKASALLKSKGIMDVHQLHGGIVTYQEQFGNEHWLGECFVFDQRLSVPVPDKLVQVGQCAHTGRTTNRVVNCIHDPCHVLFLLAAETEEENGDLRLCPNCLAAGLTASTADVNGSLKRAQAANQ
jgi:UPF0176 protein